MKNNCQCFKEDLAFLLAHQRRVCISIVDEPTKRMVVDFTCVHGATRGYSVYPNSPYWDRCFMSLEMLSKAAA